MSGGEQPNLGCPRAVAGCVFDVEDKWSQILTDNDSTAGGIAGGLSPSSFMVSIGVDTKHVSHIGIGSASPPCESCTLETLLNSHEDEKVDSSDSEKEGSEPSGSN